MLAHVISLWRGFIKFMNDSISIDHKQQRLTSANLGKHRNWRVARLTEWKEEFNNPQERKIQA